MPKPLENDDEEEEAEQPRDATETAEPEEQVESSLEELLAKRAEAPGEEEESLLDLSPEERVESLTIRAAPKQANEFVCSNCHLVKRNSQLADRRRKLCRDCV
ncbi:MAG: DUF4193 family protein [Actinomycetota bacterium]